MKEVNVLHHTRYDTVRLDKVNPIKKR